jgi:RecA-family ATPase
VIEDTLADVFGGNEIDRGQARRFVQEGLARIARDIKGAVVCCAHPSQSGVKNNTGASGSTGWGAAFRSRLYLTYLKPDEDDEAPDTDERLLTRKKANWARIGETVDLRWRDGVLVAKQSPAGILGSIGRRTAECVFLELLDQMTAQRQWVSSNVSARNYAPRLFERRATAEERARFNHWDLEKAMGRLFKNKVIDNEEYGRKGDERNHIVRVAEGPKDGA